MSTEISTNTTPARGLALQTMGEAMAFAQMVAKSDFAPKDFKGKPESCLLAIQHGSEIGLSPMQSLQSIAVINGRPCVWGDSALALVQSSPACEYVREYTEGEGDNLTAVCEVKRRGYPAANVVRFGVADAKKASLWGKSGPWQQYPQRMLALRARGFALRNTFADALRGLVTAEEAQDYQHTEPAMIRPQGQPARPLTNTVKDAGSITVAHVERFEPPQETPVGRAKIAVSKCDSISAADRLRTLMAQRLADGVFSQAEHDELVQLLHHKVEMLISDDAGQEFAHEAAEHEVTA
jgi:hypothetical protein